MATTSFSLRISEFKTNGSKKGSAKQSKITNQKCKLIKLVVGALNLAGNTAQPIINRILMISILAEEKERREQEKEKTRSARKEEANSLDMNVSCRLNELSSRFQIVFY